MAGSLGGFLTMAGGMMAGLGTLTGDKSLTKFGSILTLTGGIGSLAAPSVFGASGSAAGAGGEAAQSASEAASASSVTEPVAQSVAPQAGIGKVAELNPLGQMNAAGMTPGAASPADMGGFNMPDLDAGGPLWQRAVNPTVGNPLGEMNLGNPLGATAGDLASAASTSNAMAAGYNMPALDALQKGASSMTMKDVASFLKDNKELLKVGGDMLTSMYGPEAEALDWRKSLYERRRRNLNNPIRLGIVPGG